MYGSGWQRRHRSVQLVPRVMWRGEDDHRIEFAGGLGGVSEGVRVDGQVQLNGECIVAELRTVARVLLGLLLDDHVGARQKLLRVHSVLGCVKD